jgi:hypothetical protein
MSETELREDSYEEVNDIEFTTDGTVSPVWIDYYLNTCDTAEEISQKIKNSKTVESVSIEKGKYLTRIKASMKKRSLSPEFRINNKGFPSPGFSWKILNFMDGFDRLKISGKSNFPFIVNANQLLNRSMFDSFFEKNSIKAVYTAYPAIFSEKLQFVYKKRYDNNGQISKLAFSLGNIFDNISMTVFRVSSLSSIDYTKNVFNIKYKYSDIEFNDLPNGSSSSLKFQHDLSKSNNARYHFKMAKLVYLYPKLLPRKSNIELETHFSYSNYPTPDFINRIGFPQFEHSPKQYPFSLIHYILVKYNCYRIERLAKHNIAVFAYYSYLNEFEMPVRHAAGLGFEKVFKEQQIRAQFAFNLLKNQFQIRFDKN